jgi:hypothetical protein
MPADEMSGPVAPTADSEPVDEFDDASADVERDEQNADDQRERRVRAIVAAIILVIIAIVVLLLLRTCGTTTKKASLGDKTIVPVPAQVRAENAVSVWIKPDSTVGEVLGSAGVRATSTRSMGDGLYFVFLPDGESATALVARLKGDQRVYDAGFVYDQLKVEPLTTSK